MAKKNFEPRIGKNVIETLTLGMYDDARFIFREYIQNAADQIDIAVENKILSKKSEGEIKITIDNDEESIIIQDNATGIHSSNIYKFLGNVADSAKDVSLRKGFRGIGRLGGLGYCEKLIFETSYKGENVKSRMSLNAKHLKQLLLDKAVNLDASAVISVITDVKKASENTNAHYFRVTLQKVTYQELLNEEETLTYLSMVAPVSFHQNFPFKEKIQKHFFEKNVILDEYNVSVNDKPVSKAYKKNLVDKNGDQYAKIIAVDFFEIKNEEGELIAIGWYGISNVLNKVIHSNNVERGIRLRKSNITIGTDITLNRFFTEKRLNHYYIGEVHCISSSFMPNARRDYFNDNNTVQTFQKSLKEVFSKFGNWAGVSSKLHNRRDDIERYNKEINVYKEKTAEGFTGEGEKEHYLTQLKATYKKAVEAKKIIDKIHSQSYEDANVQRLYKTIISDKGIEIRLIEEIIDPNAGYKPPIEFSKLKANEQRIVNEIITIIDKTLDYADAQKVIRKIIELYI